MSNADRLINLTAEAALLGALLLENKLIVEVSDRVKPDDFGDALHGRIYSAIMRFGAKGLRADPLTLRPLFAHDQDCQYGDYLDTLVDSPAIVSAGPAIADQVADFAGRRKLRDAGRAFLTALEDDLDRTVDEIVAQVDEAASKVSHQDEEDIASDAGEMIGFVEDRDDEIRKNPGAAGMVNYLVDTLDEGLGNLESETYNILAGRPGMGKTAVAQSAALGYAMNGHAGVYFNLEMRKVQSGIRLAADAGHAFGYKLMASTLKKGNLSNLQRTELAAIREKVKLLPLKFVAMSAQTDIRRIWKNAARIKALWAAEGKKLEFIVIDYLGLCGATDSEGRYIDDDRKRMNVVSMCVKRMAKQLGVAVLALAQLSRGVEQRQDKRPMLSDLKESGNLEQDADSVTMVYREEYYLQQVEPKSGEKGKDGADLYQEWQATISAVRDKVEFIFAKNRHGRSQRLEAKFLSDYVAVRTGQFNDYSDELNMF